MGKPGGRFDAIVCDIDGCLCAETTAPMDTASLAWIADRNARAARDNLPPITLCSGRPQPFVEAMCRLIANQRLPCVAENGVWLYHPADNLYDMDPRVTTSDLDAVREASAWVRERLMPRGVTMQPGKAASISLYHPDTAALRAMEPEVRAEIEHRRWPLRTSMTWFYINCDLRHVDKGTGLDRMIERAGWPAPRLVGIGDTMGDLPLAERVEFFACPANADERLRARAHYVSPLPEAAGVVDILRHVDAMA